QVNGHLYQTFPKRSPSDDQAAVIVLDGTGYDFGSGGTALIDEHDDRSGLEVAFLVGKSLLIVPVQFPLLGNDDGVVVQDLIGDTDRCAHISPRVPLKVQYQFCHSFRLQFLQRLDKFIIGGSGKSGDLDITDFVIDHIRGVDAVLGDFVPRNGVIDKFAVI